MSTPSSPPSPGAHIIVCGLGHAGHRVLDLLVRLGEHVAVVTTEQPCDWPAPGHERVALHLGDARDDALLQRAGIETAKAVIVTTGDELTNISIALDARRMNPIVTVVVRLFDQQVGAHLEQSAGIHRVLSTSALAAPAFVGAALGDTVRGSFDTRDGICLIDDVTVRLGSDGCGRTVSEWCRATARATIGLRREGEWLPRWSAAAGCARGGSRGRMTRRAVPDLPKKPTLADARRAVEQAMDAKEEGDEAATAGRPVLARDAERG